VYVCSIENALRYRVSEVESHADGHGLSMPQTIRRHRLELVGGPVAEIKRTRAAQLEGIAVAADVGQMELSGAANDE
jgi:hypothetical protein